MPCQAAVYGRSPHLVIGVISSTATHWFQSPFSISTRTLHLAQRSSPVLWKHDHWQAPETSMADASHLTTSHPRQKRVLPTRSRRGGPGVGSCDVDLMILDAQKRRCSCLRSPYCFMLILNRSRQRATHSRQHTFLVNNKLGTTPALVKVGELWVQYFCQSALLRPV